VCVCVCVCVWCVYGVCVCVCVPTCSLDLKGILHGPTYSLSPVDSDNLSHFTSANHWLEG